MGASREEIRAALRDITRLADEHGRRLDKACILLADGALVGSYAADLERLLLTRHMIMRHAFSDAFEAVQRLSYGDPAGPPKMPAPRFGRAPTGAALAHNGAVGGDTALLEMLIHEMGRTGHAWQEASRDLAFVLSRVGVTHSLSARKLGEAARALIAEQPELRRRLEFLIASDEVGFDVGRGAGSAVLATVLAGLGLPAMPLGADPRTVAAWWAGLTARQRRTYITAVPSILGWLDGLPSKARNAANRLTLTRRLQALESKPLADLTEFEQRDLSRLRNLSTRLQALESRGHDVFLLGLDSTTEGPTDTYAAKPNPFRYLPNSDGLHGTIADLTKGPDGRVIVAIGNPDKAHHSGIFVPGTTAQLDGLQDNLDRVERLYLATHDQLNGQPISMTLWMDYDAPDHILSDSPVAEYADRGGPQLDRFVNGVRAAQGDHHRHLTVIGHSYGSTVVGEGARIGNGLNVDDIIVVGSPGMRVSSPAELHMSPDRVWAEAAPDDAVPIVGRFGHGGGGKFIPFPILPVVPIVPSDPEFGGQRLVTDTDGHSDYWNQGTQSLRNQSLVVAGMHLNRDPTDDPATRP